MSHRPQKPIPAQSAVAGALLLSLLGCMQATHTTARTARTAPATASALGAANALLTAVGSRAMSIFETQTVSLALDRIDQRDLPLDRTYRRTGTGSGVSVYVFDGGIMAHHPELAGRVRHGYDAYPLGPLVCNAHGTAVAGAVAGRSLGVAPDAEIVDVKIVDCSKLRGTINAIVQGAEWVIQDARKHGRPSVANWSFIADTASNIPALDTAIARLRAAGIPVVVSAGNLDINACRVSPGNADGAIVVGSSAVARITTPEGPRMIDRRAPNTAYGSCVDLYAPGDSVLLPSFDQSLSATVQLWNGTSMSAGYVSGALALHLEANPTATPDEAREALKAGATMNVIANAGSTTSWLLYVGADRSERARLANATSQD